MEPYYSPKYLFTPLKEYTAGGAGEGGAGSFGAVRKNLARDMQTRKANLTRSTLKLGCTWRCRHQACAVICNEPSVFACPGSSSSHCKNRSRSPFPRSSCVTYFKSLCKKTFPSSYRSSFKSPILIHPIFRRISPKIKVSTAGSTKQTSRIPSHIEAPPPMAV